MIASYSAPLRRGIGLLSLAGALLSGGGAGRAVASALPASPHLPVVRATLANGLRIVVLPDHLAPVVTTWLNVLAGSDDEPYTGLAHAQEHMFYRGSKTLSGAQADEIAGFTGDEDNADTQSVITQYFHTVPSQALGLVLRLDASRFSAIDDFQSDWNEERGAIEEEVRHDNSDAGYRLAVKVQHQLLAGTPYADEGLGTLHSFDTQINAPQLRAFYHTWYHPNNAIYVIAGDVDPATTIAAVKANMGALPRVALPSRAAIHLQPLRPATFSDDSDQGSTTVIVGYRYPGTNDRDYAASVLLADALNSQRAETYALVAGGKALDTETDTNDFPQASFVTITEHVPVGTKPANAIVELKNVIEDYRKTGIPGALVEAAKQREIAEAATAADSIKGLAETWSQTLATEGRSPEDDIAAISRVTKADVDRVLRTYLVNATASVAYAVPKNGASGDGGGGGPSGETAKAQQTKIEPLPAWAQTALRGLQPPVRPQTATDFTLPNGLRVLVRPDHTSAAVVVEGEVRHDDAIEEPEHQLGVGDIVDDVMPYGTATYSRLDYQAQIDAIAATVKAGFSFSFSGLSSHFDRGMQLLADDELHPAFNEADFKIVREQHAAAIEGEASTPNHLAAVATAQHLYPAGDPAQRFASAADVRALTLDDLKSYYTKAFRPDLTTIAIVGDVTPERARAVVEHYFGDWQADGSKPDLIRKPVVDNVAFAQTIPATGRVQDTVRLSQTLGLGQTDPDIAPLEIADAVLSGDFSSILIRDMRVTTGYVYSVGTAVRAGEARSVFTVQYGCAPAFASKAEAVLERDLRALGTTDISQDRLLRAKSHLLANLALDAASYDSLATQLASDGANGLPVDQPYREALAEYDTSADSVRAAAARWIRPNDFVRITEGPTPR